MKRSMLALALVAAALSACDDYSYEEAETMPPPIEAAPMAPSVEDQSVDTAETVVEPAPPVEAPLAPDERTSEETVTPESETLFY